MGVKFSVIVPTTGGRMENLDLVLTSLERQYFPRDDFEVIVVNDGGELETRDLVADYQGKFGKLSYILSSKFVPISLPQVAPLDIEATVTIWGEGGDIVKLVPNEQPRNKGARQAENPFYIFADSDVILPPNTLALYNEDMSNNPSRIMLGIYHWLHPMIVTHKDVIERFDDVIHHRLQKIPLSEPQTHNICRAALACFSGNICWPKDLFWGIGGYDNHVHAGAHEDGLSGLTAYFKGYGISYDKRIVGGHLYHGRNVNYIQSFKWQEIEYINSQFEDEPEFKGVIEATQREQEALGVAGWKKEW